MLELKTPRSLDVAVPECVEEDATPEFRPHALDAICGLLRRLALQSPDYAVTEILSNRTFASSLAKPLDGKPKIVQSICLQGDCATWERQGTCYLDSKTSGEMAADAFSRRQRQ